MAFNWHVRYQSCVNPKIRAKHKGLKLVNDYLEAKEKAEMETQDINVGGSIAAAVDLASAMLHEIMEISVSSANKETDIKDTSDCNESASECCPPYDEVTHHQKMDPIVRAKLNQGESDDDATAVDSDTADAASADDEDQDEESQLVLDRLRKGLLVYLFEDKKNTRVLYLEQNDTILRWFKLNSVPRRGQRPRAPAPWTTGLMDMSQIAMVSKKITRVCLR